jgi:hypothetical protein
VPPACRGRWLLACSTASSLLLLGGCGGHDAGPALRRDDAQRLIALTRRVAATTDGCAQQRQIHAVQAAAIRLVNAHRVPAALQESLLGGVNALAADMPACLPSAPPATASTDVTERVAHHGPPKWAGVHMPTHGHHGHGHGQDQGPGKGGKGD